MVCTQQDRNRINWRQISGSGLLPCCNPCHPHRARCRPQTWLPPLPWLPAGDPGCDLLVAALCALGGYYAACSSHGYRVWRRAALRWASYVPLQCVAVRSPLPHFVHSAGGRRAAQAGGPFGQGGRQQAGAKTPSALWAGEADRPHGHIPTVEQVSGELAGRPAALHLRALQQCEHRPPARYKVRHERPDGPRQSAARRRARLAVGRLRITNIDKRNSHTPHNLLLAPALERRVARQLGLSRYHGRRPCGAY